MLAELVAVDQVLRVLDQADRVLLQHRCLQRGQRVFARVLRIGLLGEGLTCFLGDGCCLAQVLLLLPPTIVQLIHAHQAS